MKKFLSKKIANGETSISTKIIKFNDKIGVLEELKVRMIERSDDKSIDKKVSKQYYSDLYKLECLLEEIKGDNEVYFRGTLSYLVSTLEQKLIHIKNMN